MSKERYNQIIDEVYNIYIQRCIEDIDEFIKNNPGTLIDYQEDTKEHFIESIKNNRHWFSGKLGFADERGLKIEERELSLEERVNLLKNIDSRLIPTSALMKSIVEPILNEHNIPTKQTTLTYQNEKIEVYE